MQERQIKDVRVVRPEYKAIHTHLLQDTLHRLDKAYKAFFRRVQAGEEKPGYPRFKGRGRYRTFTFKDVANRNGARIVANGQRVDLSGIGRVKVKLRRRVEGTVKQVSVTLGGDGHWYVAFACVDVPSKPLPSSGQSVGVDVGLKTFATLSTGEEVANPRPFVRAQKRLANAHRRVARRKKGTKRLVPTQVMHTLGVSHIARVSESELIATFEVQNLTDATVYDQYRVPRPGRGFYFKLAASR